MKQTGIVKGVTVKKQGVSDKGKEWKIYAVEIENFGKGTTFDAKYMDNVNKNIEFEYTVDEKYGNQFGAIIRVVEDGALEASVKPPINNDIIIDTDANIRALCLSAAARACSFVTDKQLTTTSVKHVAEDFFLYCKKGL